MTETYRINISNEISITIEKVKGGPFGYGIHSPNDRYDIEWPKCCKTLMAEGRLTREKINEMLEILNKLAV